MACDLDGERSYNAIIIIVDVVIKSDGCGSREYGRQRATSSTRIRSAHLRDSIRQELDTKDAGRISIVVRIEYVSTCTIYRTRSSFTKKNHKKTTHKNKIQKHIYKRKIYPNPVLSIGIRLIEIKYVLVLNLNMARDYLRSFYFVLCWNKNDPYLTTPVTARYVVISTLLYTTYTICFIRVHDKHIFYSMFVVFGRLAILYSL